MDLSRLTTTRGAHRGQLTKLMKKGDEVIEKLSEPATNTELQTMHALYQTMITKLDHLRELDIQISTETAVEELEAMIINSDDHINEYVIKLEKYKQFALMYKPERSESDHNASFTSRESTAKRKVNLPKLTLPKFDGNFLKWISFIDTFKSAVDNDLNLEEVQKFQYLVAQLTGDAARAVQGLQLTHANYKEALEILQNRFGQPHKLIASYMKALWELPKPNDGLSSVREFHDNLETYLRGLKSLGKNEDSYGDLLVPIVLEKLPGNIKQQIARDHGDKAWTINELKCAIFKEIQAAEAGGGNVEYNLNPYAMPIASTSTFIVNSNRLNYNKTKSCAFCKGDHYSNQCTVVVDVKKRLDIVKRDLLCFNCLKPRHRVSDCQSKGRCRICKRKHNTTICDKVDERPKETPLATEKPKETTHATLTPTSNPVLLKTAVGIIKSVTGNSTKVNILFDEGAQRTFMVQSTADKLGVGKDTSKPEIIHLAAFGSEKINTQHLNSTIISLTTNKGPVELNTLVVPKISTPVKNFTNFAVASHTYLQNLTLAQPVTGDKFEIDLLIGADHYWSVIEDKIVRGPGPTAVASKLGFLLSGPIGTVINPVSALTTYCLKVLTNPTFDDNTRPSLYWDLETMGITDDSNSKIPDFNKYRDENIRRDADGRYTASLPWKEDHPPLPTNYGVTKARTKSMIKRLTPEIVETYDDIIKDQISRDFVEEVNHDDPKQGHYLPHHSVVKDSATTPIRIVYDCSFKSSDSPSLNDCLETGPSLINDLGELLVRFRVNQVAFTSDIEKAFLNVRLDEHDREYTKFFWLSEPKNPESDLKTYRFKSVLFGSTSSPFILNSVIKTHLESEDTTVAKDLKDNIYVDNVISGINDNKMSPVEYYETAIQTMKRGGFTLRSWATNDASLNTLTERDGVKDSHKLVNVLGLSWCTENDYLTYTPPKVTQSKSITKREVLKITSSLFDPLGLLAPVHVKAKLFIQKLWQSSLQWDDPLTDNLSHEWVDIKKQLDLARSTIIKRKYFDDISILNREIGCELHIFSDASTKAYGAVAHRKRNQDTAIVMAKTRVKPLKDMTLPRLELMGALIGTRLCKFLLKALSNVNITKHVLWCDSQICIHWIKSTKKLPIFVENRVKEIRSVKFTEINYCPTQDNPADALTRGITSECLNQSKLWWKGPQWLPEGDWPVSNVFDSSTLACITENCFPPTTVLVNAQNNHDHNIGLHSVIDINRFSSLKKLLHVTTYVLRFISLMKKKGVPKGLSKLTTNDLLKANHAAKHAWIVVAQNDSYGKERSALLENKKTKFGIINQLNLFTDKNGLIRCGGRFQNSDLKYEEKFPILLPNNHPFTRLVINDTHETILHSGVESTLTHIRHRYWIPKIRQVVKSVLRKCVPCVSVVGRPYPSPETPPLPNYRIKETEPFSVTGVDFTGAIYYKDAHSKANKAYLCLFTCAVTRGVHLEIVTDMTASAFIRAFRRFTSRRGIPTHMISDNATTFLAAAEEIKRIINDHLVDKNVKWSFIPKRAPWFGGFYERLIGITKNTLKKVLGHACVTLDELITVTAEAEAVINERPITYVTASVEEITPLTPSHLINGRLITPLPHYQHSEDDPDFTIKQTKSDIDKRKQYLDKLFENMWKRWRYEYLPALREDHQANTKKIRGTKTVKVGDVVHIHSDTQKRINWHLGYIKELNVGNDGLVRSAVIQTKSGITNRPVTKLYPLEITHEHHDDTSNDEDLLDVVDPYIAVRPMRKAQARDNLKTWANILR